MEPYKNNGKLRQTLGVLCASLGSFGLGNVLGWTSPSLPNLQASNDLGHISGKEASWIASIAILGALASGPLAGYFLQRIGRRASMTLFSLPFTLGWLLIAAAKYQPSLMYFGRFITGLCGGTFTVIIPVYVGETVDDELKGMLGSLMVLMLVSGILFSYVVGAFSSWLILSLTCASFPFLLFLLTGLSLIPETPKFLLANQLLVEADAAASWLRGAKGQNQGNEVPQLFLTEKRDSKVVCSPSKLSSRRMYIIKPVIICATLIFFQQLGGINSVTMYTVDIFKSASEGINANLASIMIGVVQVVFVALSMAFVDRLGRKPLLMASSLIMCISLVCLGGFFYVKEQNDSTASGFPSSISTSTWIPIVSLTSFIIAYSFGMGPIPWLLVSELLHPELKSECSGIITFIYWGLAFGATKTYQDLLSLFHASGCYWIYACICLAATLFTYIFVPETKGKSSTDIRKHFGDVMSNSTALTNCEDGSTSTSV